MSRSKRYVPEVRKRAIRTVSIPIRAPVLDAHSIANPQVAGADRAAVEASGLPTIRRRTSPAGLRLAA